jgi:sulfur-oxidizing protein SoxX
MSKTAYKLLFLWAIGELMSCANKPMPSDIDQLTKEVIETSFHDRGQAGLQRLTKNDQTNILCSLSDASGIPISKTTEHEIELENYKTIQWPASGQYLGDWKKGEAIAQSGRGKTWSDDIQTPNGGNCYNCHQISPQEISYGTLGPSLYQYGTLRGVGRLTSQEMQPVIEYTWGKIWNAKAYNACSVMPRAGHMGILTPEQISHLVALLLDPQSPVNH